MGVSRESGRGLGVSSWGVDREVSREVGELGFAKADQPLLPPSRLLLSLLIIRLFLLLFPRMPTYLPSGNTAAAFFTTYEYLKRTLPKNIDVLERAPAANHLVSSMGAEIVSRFDVLSERVCRLTRYG
jgi:hypothetical protein